MCGRVDGQRDSRTASALAPIAVLAQHTRRRTVCALSHPVQRPLNAMGCCLCRETQHPVVDANATVVVNIFTLEIVVEDISTEGEAKGLKTAHETLLDKAGWTRPYCFGGAVQKGKFRPVSGFLNGLREGYKAVTAPGYAGQLTAHGTLAADTASEELEAFKKFTKEKENREKAQIPEEAVRVALHLAASREHGLKKSSFFMDPLLHAETLEYLCSFEGGMEDPIANQQMLQKVLAIKEQHFGEHHPEVALTLHKLSNALSKLGNIRMGKGFLERALKIFEAHYGEEHYVVATTLGNLGVAYTDLEEYEKAKDILEQALIIKEKLFDQDHFEVAKPLTNLGIVYEELRKYDKAKELLERALKIEEEHFHEDHFAVAQTLENLGAAYAMLGDHDKAKDILERAVNIKVRHYGQDHIQVAMSLHNLAVAHGSLGEYQQAAEMLERVLPVYEDHYGADHGRCNDVRRALNWATR